MLSRYSMTQEKAKFSTLHVNWKKKGFQVTQKTVKDKRECQSATIYR